MNTINHSIESEMKAISICWNKGASFNDLKDTHFYDTRLGLMYKTIVDHGQFNTDTDMTKYNLDADLFFKCIDTNAFSENELPILTNTIREMHHRREEIKKKQLEIAELNDLSASVSHEETQDGFEDLINEQVEIKEGMFEQLDTPWPYLQHDSLFTEGKAIVVLCGDPGVGKSFFVTQLFLGFVVNRKKAILWGAEDNTRFHTRRAIAQYIGDSRLCSYQYLQDNHAEVIRIYGNNKDIIERIMKSLYSNKDHTRESLIAWCWAKARAGYEIIGIDPITFFSSNEKAHTADLLIMEELDKIRTEFGTRFIIVTHPKASEGAKVSMDGIAGGKAISRFAQVMLWIVKNEDSTRTVYTTKTRNGSRSNGGNTHMVFNPQNVCFEEIPSNTIHLS